MNEGLSAADREELLRIARATLREHLATGYLPPGAPHRKTLLEPGAVAVTLKVGGEPRGQAASIEANRPLYRAVEEATVAALKSDSQPLRLEELGDARLTIALLSRPEPCVPEAIAVGRHGLVVTRGPRRGMVLPELALERGWDALRLLDETCARAGLPPGAWREPGTRVEQFTAETFRDPT